MPLGYPVYQEFSHSRELLAILPRSFIRYGRPPNLLLDWKR